MKCPVCKSTSLQSVPASNSPDRSVCSKCDGQWIKSFQYWKWIKAHGENLPETPPEQGACLPVSDSSGAKLCPECGHFLTRNRVGHGIEFHLDRCQNCGGIWLDKNEWKVLESRNLHDDIHFIFSSIWQSHVLEEELARVHDARVETILGQEDFERTRAFKSWVQNHEERNTIMAYLSGLSVWPRTPPDDGGQT